MMAQHPKSSFQAYLERKRAAEASPSLTDVAAAMNVPVFPCDANKKPLTLHGFKDATTSAEAIRSAFARPGAVMIGVPTGAITGLVIIDIDVKDGAIGQVWLDAHSHLLPQTRTIKTGSGGLHLYFKHPGTRIPNSASKVAKNVDVRGDGGYVIVPPSPGYQVADPSDVAAIPDWLLPALLPAPEPAHTPVQRSRPPSTTGGTPYGLAALDSACDAIRHAHNGSKHDTLNREAYSIGGLVTGQELEQGVAFQALSAALQDIRPACKDFRAAQRTLSQAFRDGMGRPRDVPDRLPPPEEVHPAAGFLAKLYVKQPQAPIQPIAPGLLDVDGVLKILVEECTRTAIRPQPFLALGAAIAAVGALAGRRYRTPTDLRTNVYIAAVCESGGGKDHAPETIRRAFIEAGLDRFLGGENLASGKAVLSSIQQHPARLFLIDELGLFLKTVTGPKAPTHRAEIWSELMKLYSRAKGVYGGTEYADQKLNARVNLHAPHACFYGTTTPSTFWAALENGAMVDGSLARFLVMVTDEHLPPRNRSPEIFGASEELILALQAIAAGPEAHNPGNLQAATMVATVPIVPYTVPFTPDALQLHDQNLDAQDRWAKKVVGTPQSAIVNRWGENAAKLALIHAVSRDPANPSIALRDVQWGWLLAEHCLRGLLTEAGKHMADSEFERRLNKAKEIIRKHGPLSDSELLRRGLKIPERDRQEVLRTLTASGDVIAIPSDPGPSGGRPTIRYQATGQNAETQEGGS